VRSMELPDTKADEGDRFIECLHFGFSLTYLIYPNRQSTRYKLAFFSRHC
jgi:hypothetical protein